MAKFFPTLLERENWIEWLGAQVDEGKAAVFEHEGKTMVAPRMLSWAIDQYLFYGEKNGWRPATYKTRRGRLALMLKFLGDIPLGAISRAVVIRFIESGGKNESRKSFCSDAVAFLNWCGNLDQGRNWIPAFKFSKLSWKRLREDQKAVGILEPAEARLLMEGITDEYKAAMALTLFAGIRPYGELSALQWEDIQFKRKRIIIKPSVSKNRTQRTLSDLPKNLWAWLGKHKGTGLVIQSYNSFRLARNRTCKHEGISYPKDGARHSFASYGYWRGEEWCRRVMGHTEATDVFHRVYVDAGPSEEESKEYFGIFPEADG